MRVVSCIVRDIVVNLGAEGSFDSIATRFILGNISRIIYLLAPTTNPYESGFEKLLHAAAGCNRITI